ncbi:MAG: hypothetical protein KJP04_02675, partial [Arenicella sp.]|nr:hypothetical protein [Arenicella sp.]
IRQWSTQIEQSDSPSEPLRWEHQGQEYSATFKRIPAGGDMDLEKVLIEVITHENGAQLSTQMRLKKLAFSNFAQFVHRWDRDLQFHDDIVDGRFHSNSRIHLEVGPDAQPVFHGRVTTASHSVDINRSGRLIRNESVFLDGLETGIRKIDMPISNVLYADTPRTGQGATHFFDQDTRIIFAANEQFLWHHINGDGILHAQPIGDQPIRIQAAKGVSLYVSGEVAGKVLLFSPKRIVIEGDLVYAGHPGSSDGDNFLGLVSARNVDIARSRVTGAGDLKIDAAIYAQRKFTVRGRTVNNHGTLRIFGSLSAGSLTATEPRYATKIVFDPRLEEHRPPGFPVTDRFELAVSDEYWTSSAEIPEQPLTGDYIQ